MPFIEGTEVCAQMGGKKEMKSESCLIILAESLGRRGERLLYIERIKIMYGDALPSSRRRWSRLEDQSLKNNVFKIRLLVLRSFDV